jgi:hypothetical protein
VRVLTNVSKEFAFTKLVSSSEFEGPRSIPRSADVLIITSGRIPIGTVSFKDLKTVQRGKVQVHQDQIR